MILPPSRDSEPDRTGIEEPLGQNRKPPRRRPVLPRAGNILAAAIALCLVAVSTAIALRDRPFRDPPRATTSTPVADAAPRDLVSAAPPDDALSADGASGDDAAPSPSILSVGEGEAGDSAEIVVRDPSNMPQNPSVAHLPDRALIEESEMGPLPVRGADGRRPFDVYAGQWSGKPGARIALVIGGLGLSQTGTQDAIRKLRPEVTLAFAPQGNSLDRWMREARRDGHEILIQVPLEPFDYPNVNPGRNTLTVEASPGENLRELRWALSRITNYTGIVNYMGARFIANRDAMTELMTELGRRGLMFLDDGSSARSLAGRLADDKGVPFASGDVLIDQSRERGSIIDNLDKLEDIARADGTAIGIGSAFDVTVDTVHGWVEDARKHGIEIVPVSALADDPQKE